MSETKFTKGEWHVQDYNEIDGTIRVNQGNIVITYANHTEESEANAHLIAAAPEMYAMLEGLLKNLLKGEECDVFEKDASIESLLAKARGEHE